ncbi:helix-turn-helix domain-containing protein [Stieleria sp. TO1_6]|uniref:helix-turn-helix transcriptional regulator n=1 Tax=Stieleria tagensis TaxID=2956795 RepID=UPI00209B7D1A|nr:helix-turn-helix domain-containing protein [Stieleria tagensis]MCO8121321.1 helix-turn-helix domain-containing protein [Stieleria tagensis]
MSDSIPSVDDLPPLLIDIKQVAKLLGVSAKSVQRMRDMGNLPKPKKLGRSIRWRYEDIRKFVERL